VTLLLAEMLAAVEFDDLHLFCAALRENLGSDLTTFDIGGTNLYRLAFAYHKDFVELDNFACGDFQFFELQRLAFRDPVLLTATNYYRVHISLRNRYEWTLDPFHIGAGILRKIRGVGKGYTR
jgi:hypothetical protein